MPYRSPLANCVTRIDQPARTRTRAGRARSRRVPPTGVAPSAPSTLYASTAGIATTSPNAVMISASPTGPATFSISAWPAFGDAAERVIDAPHGAEQADERRGAATDASNTWPNSSRRCDLLRASRNGAQHTPRCARRVRGARPVSRLPPHAARLLRAVRRRVPRSASRSAATPSDNVEACQKIAMARAPCRFARPSTQLLTIRKHQLAIDMASST